MAQEDADMVPEEGDMVREAGNMAPEVTVMAQEDGVAAPEEGDMAQEDADVVPEEGDMVREAGNMAPEEGDTATEAGSIQNRKLPYKICTFLITAGSAKNCNPAVSVTAYSHLTLTCFLSTARRYLIFGYPTTSTA